MDLQTLSAAKPLQKPEWVNCPARSGNTNNYLQTLLLFLTSPPRRATNSPGQTP